MQNESEAGIELRSLRHAEDLRECARMMAASEPWITLGRTYDDSFTTISDPSKEVSAKIISSTTSCMGCWQVNGKV